QVREVFVVQSGGLDQLVLRYTFRGPDDLNPTGIHSSLDEVHLVVRIFAVLLVPEIAGQRIDSHSKAIANAVSEDLLEVCSDLVVHRSAQSKERIVRRSGAVRVKSQDHAGKMCVV